MTRVIVSQQGEWILSEANLKTALGIPPDANVTNAFFNTTDNTLHVQAVEPTSDTGQP